MNRLKRFTPYGVAVLLFLAFAVFYCYPVLQGKVVNAGDTYNWLGAAHQNREYMDQTGEAVWWTESMFSGMPAYQITSRIPSLSVSNVAIREVLHLGLGETMGILFGYLLGFFVLLRCFRVNPWLSIAGAFAIGLSTYFLLIIPAGHITKAMALGLLPPVVGGFYRIFQRDYLVGFPVITIFGMASVILHPQMTYYIAMLTGVLACAELFIHLRERRFRDLGIGIGVLLLALVLILGTKISWWGLNREYLQETMRGGHSELTTVTDEGSNETTATTNAYGKSGLSLDYATAWSYGIDETMTFLIPNFMGAASGYNVGEKSVLYRGLTGMHVPKSQARRFCEGAPTYRGEKAFTSGPVYMGAIVCFLFVLALLIVPDPYKWALLIATLFSVLLAWGRNFMPLTEWFFRWFPMYNKFRAVESILIVAEITMPLLAFLGLQRFTANWQADDRRSQRRPVLIAAGITGGLCLLFGLLGGSLCDFSSSYDASWQSQVGDDIYRLILDQRATMLRSDAWRSFLFIVLAAGLLLWADWKKPIAKKHTVAFAAAVLALVLADLIPVNLRFFSSKDFVSPKQAESRFAMQPWEEQILRAEQPGERVLNLTANTFNDSRTSYRLNSIGGYHAAKLRRYQDLIDAHISRNNMQVLNMLNTRFFITRNGVSYNPDAFGPAWFVDSVTFVGSPDAESAALWTTDLRHTAVADSAFLPLLTLAHPSDGAGKPATIARTTPTNASPDRLFYQADTEAERVAVFSEIYYPHGWHLFVDEQEVPLARVDYALRAAIIPAGSHSLRMVFRPDALRLDPYAYAVTLAALLLALLAIIWKIRNYVLTS